MRAGGAFVTRIVDADADKEEIFKLRYKVYIEEMHRHQPDADHQGKTIIDALDGTATLLGCFHDSAAIGTCRMNFSDSSRFEHRELYAFDWFERRYGKVAFLTKMMILPEWRDRDVFTSLARLMYRTGLDQGAAVGILDCNDHLIEMYKHFGFIPYKGRVPHPLYGMVTPMVLHVHDEEHLRRANSPLLALCTTFKSQRLQAGGMSHE